MNEGVLNYIFTKKFTCPVCEKEFNDVEVRRSKLRTQSVQTDFRTIYKDFEPTHYDVKQCTHCGYASMSAYFDKITERQKEMIRKNITPSFVSKEPTPPYDLDTVVERYDQALKCVDVISGKTSQKALTALKLAWVYRANGSNDALEKHYLRMAFTGLKQAYSTENFPLGNMDESTAKYVIADLARRSGDFGEALRWVSDVIVARGIPGSLKERAVDLKELIQAKQTN